MNEHILAVAATAATFRPEAHKRLGPQTIQVICLTTNEGRGGGGRAGEHSQDIGMGLVACTSPCRSRRLCGALAQSETASIRAQSFTPNSTLPCDQQVKAAELYDVESGRWIEAPNAVLRDGSAMAARWQSQVPVSAFLGATPAARASP